MNANGQAGEVVRRIIAETHPFERTYYRGWIPTVSGYLSFSVIGQCDHPTKTISANVVDDTDRYVVAFQRRSNDDPLLPWISPWIPIIRANDVIGLRRDRDLFFVLIAHARKTGSKPNSLNGSVLVYRRKDWRAARKFYRRTQKFLTLFEKSTKPRHEKLYPRADRALRTSSAPSLATFEFSIQRNGLVAITMINVNPDVKLVDERESKRQSFDEKWVKDQLAAQAFYFLRDMTHRHQHHSPCSDLMTTLHHVGPPGETAVAPLAPTRDDIVWLRRVYQHLTRGVIRQKREGDEPALEESLGILAYALSFQRIAREHLQTAAASDDDKKAAGEFPENVTHNHDMLKASIEARLKTKATELRIHDSSIRSRFSSSALILAFCALNTTILVGSLKENINIKSQEIIYNIYSYISSNILISNSSVIAAIILIIYIKTPKSKAGDLFDTRIGRAFISGKKWKSLAFAVSYVAVVGALLYLTFQLPPIHLPIAPSPVTIGTPAP